MSGLMRLATPTPQTATGTILGTVQYMAPEQVEGKEADARSDIWALGAVVYEMATGTKPFKGDTPASVIGAILKDQPPPLSERQPLIPAMLDRLVSRCLAKDPDDRWQSAADLHQALTWISDGVIVPAGARARGRPTRVHLLPIAIGALLLLAVVGSPYRTNYAVAANGQRFLVNTSVESATPSPITVVLNWTVALNK